MLTIGRWNNLKVIKFVDFGIYLDGGDSGNILLPLRYLPDNVIPDDFLDVFIYKDSEDRLIATTEIPFAQVGEFAFLKIVSVNDVGAFADWGLSKDLLIPFGEQKTKMKSGEYHLIAVFLDPVSMRIAGSSKLDKYLDNLPVNYVTNQQVDLIISHTTDLGYKAIINNAHWGILYFEEAPVSLKIGTKLKGYIKKVRDDEKIDLCLSQPGYAKIDPIAEKILQKLHENDGFLPLTDKSSSEMIFEIFQESKKSFKKALGLLYKKGAIILEENGIHLK